MPIEHQKYLHLLLACCALFFLLGLGFRMPALLGLKGMLYGDGRIFGGDFINLWSAGRLMLAGRTAEIYQPDLFQAYQQALAGGSFGIRLWAYPPHSLFLAPPFALLDFYSSLVAWTLLGLAILWFGARQFGFGRLETLVILVSPATQLCIDNGQTGNLVTGLFLVALAPASRTIWLAPLAGAVLTIKPQLGLLLPVYWALERRWRDIGVTAVLVIIVLGLAWTAFGPPIWQAYAGATLDTLTRLEKYGSGPFTAMIPSVFMSLRLVTGDPDFALAAHLVFAAVSAAFVLWKMLGADSVRRAGLVLIGTVLITPYIHNYDLNLLVCACLMALRRIEWTSQRRSLATPFVLLAFSVPIMVMSLNPIGFPIAPLMMAPLLFLL